MRAYLDHKARNTGQPTSADVPETRTGTIFHGFQDIAATRKDNTYQTSAIEFTDEGADFDGSEEACRQQAEEMFGAHRARYKLDYLGEIVESEYDIPQTEAQKEAIIAAEWNRTHIDITCRIDRVLKINRNKIRRIFNEFGMMLSEPGGYLHDFKTGSHRWAQSYRTEIAPRLYQLLYNATHKVPCRGMIVEVVEKTRQARSLPIFIPPPNETVTKIVAQHLYDAHIVREMVMEDSNPHPNTKHCHDYGRLCRHAKGECPVKEMIDG
jgi:hypothetical protein